MALHLVAFPASPNLGQPWVGGGRGLLYNPSALNTDCTWQLRTGLGKSPSG